MNYQQEYQRRYWQEHKDRLNCKRRERKEEIAEYMREYRRKNRERLKQQTRDWLDNNPGKRTEYKVRWRKKYSDKQRDHAYQYVSKRRTRKLAAFVEDVDRNEVLRLSGFCCGICKRPIAKGKKFHIDHVVPLSKGGLHCYENVQAAHPSCNLKKGSRKEVKEIQRRNAASQNSEGYRVAIPGRNGNRRSRRNSKRRA